MLYNKQQHQQHQQNSNDGGGNYFKFPVHSTLRQTRNETNALSDIKSLTDGDVRIDVQSFLIHKRKGKY